ncbi:hypothetical protein D3C85_1840740 [compost metagenome]
MLQVIYIYFIAAVFLETLDGKQLRMLLHGICRDKMADLSELLKGVAGLNRDVDLYPRRT